MFTIGWFRENREMKVWEDMIKGECPKQTKFTPLTKNVQMRVGLYRKVKSELGHDQV